MKFTCPHCKKAFTTNLGAMLGARRTEKKAEASRLNGATSGGRPVNPDPVRLRPYHKNHPKHAEYLAEQARKNL